MTNHATTTPGFGQADLSNCEREQIHLAASIQPHGGLLLVRESDHVIVQASANVAELLGLANLPIGQTLMEIGGDLAQQIADYAGEPLDTLPKAVRCHFGPSGVRFDGSLHRPPGGGLIVELEPASPPVDRARQIDSALRTILDAASLRQLCDDVVRLFRDLTGYDRVMVYRFDDDGHGEVFAEARVAGREPYLGNHYPVTDIPQIARRLYERNRVRMLVDVNYQPVPLIPRESPFTGQDLDMSLCTLRSMSPIHIQYLQNMGVSATLVVSLMVGGRLWGLVACHHYAAHTVAYEVRAVCELLSEAIGTRIAALQSFQQGRAELFIRRLEQRLIEAISREGDWRTALFDTSHSLLKPLDATGVALLFEDQVLTAGEVPGTAELREIGAWLDRQPRAPVIATAALGHDCPELLSLAAVASGVIAAPVSSSPGEYLIWFRPEQVRTLIWGGNPFSPIAIGDDPASLSPRRSFSQWHQLVEKTSEPWTLSDQTAARLVGETVADVVLQFRTLRVLIAQDQLSKIRGQVRDSDQPVIIADAEGQILLANDAFQLLLRPSKRQLRCLDELPALFRDGGTALQRIRELVEEGKTWRGEANLLVALNDDRPFMVRADPVYSSPGRILGFVFLFTDLSERKSAEAARERFQRDILSGQRRTARGLDTKADLLFRSLLTVVVENAQLAALEITDGADVTRVPDLLDGVRTSVSRSSEVLRHLIWRASKREN